MVSSSSPYSHNQGLSVAISPPHQSCFLVTRQGVSVLACSKLCTICFVVGVAVGFTLKRRVKHWASKLLKRLKDY